MRSVVRWLSAYARSSSAMSKFDRRRRIVDDIANRGAEKPSAMCRYMMLDAGVNNETMWTWQPGKSLRASEATAAVSDGERIHRTLKRVAKARALLDFNRRTSTRITSSSRHSAVRMTSTISHALRGAPSRDPSRHFGHARNGTGFYVRVCGGEPLHARDTSRRDKAGTRAARVHEAACERRRPGSHP